MFVVFVVFVVFVGFVVFVVLLSSSTVVISHQDISYIPHIQCYTHAHPIHKSCVALAAVVVATANIASTDIMNICLCTRRRKSSGPVNPCS